MKPCCISSCTPPHGTRVKTCRPLLLGQTPLPTRPEWKSVTVRWLQILFVGALSLSSYSDRHHSAQKPQRVESFRAIAHNAHDEKLPRMRRTVMMIILRLRKSLRELAHMWWLWLVDRLNYRSLLQKSPIKKKIFCKGDLYFDRSYWL